MRSHIHMGHGKFVHHRHIQHAVHNPHLLHRIHGRGTSAVKKDVNTFVSKAGSGEGLRHKHKHASVRPLKFKM